MDNLDSLRHQLKVAENFSSNAQNVSSSLQNLVRRTKQRLDATKTLVERSEQEKEEAYLICKNAVSELGSSLSLLHQQCQTLNASTCPKNPKLLCQMPLDGLQADRKAFENDLKLLIIKQFQKVPHLIKN
jgi:uncharacterized protein YoxC